MSAPEVLSAKIQDVIFGDRVKIVEPCNLYGCDLGDDVFVGPFVEIQSAVIVGDRTVDGDGCAPRRRQEGG